MNVKLFCIGFFLLFSTFVHGFQYTLSICAIFQNEAPYMKEWIDYHRKVGVEHFWLYNNESNDNYLEILQPYIDEGIVELTQWPTSKKGWSDTQFTANTDGVNKAKIISKWLAIIDIDEFIVPKSAETIPEILETKFSKYGGVCVNWQCFGTSNIEQCPDNLMLPYLTMKMKWDGTRNRIFKSIVQPIYVKTAFTHRCAYHSKKFGVDTHNYRQEEKAGAYASQQVFIDVMQINHYWTRDEKYFREKKIPRYNKWRFNDETIIKMKNELNEEYDDYILRFID